MSSDSGFPPFSTVTWTPTRAAIAKRFASEKPRTLDLKTGREVEPMFVGGKEAGVLFDHDGTTMLVRDDGYTTYLTFDLPSRLFMQGFPDP